MRALIRATLERSNKITVVGEASDPLEARTAIKALNPDVVTLDVEMPNMNGIEFIRALRQLAPYRGVPIVFLTTESDDEVKKQAKAAGATGWITKPFKQDQLLAVAKKFLG